MTCSLASTTRPTRSLDIESLSWWRRLHAVDPVRRVAIAELHDRLRVEARFQIGLRATRLPDFPRSDVDDLAVQAADDALLVLLRKLDDYRGDSRFWTWARRFAELEAPVSIRRRLGHEHRATPGAIYKTLHDARAKLRAEVAL